MISTEENKSEFINGQIIIQSPVKHQHNEYSGLLYQLLNIYVSQNDLGFVGIEKIMISLTRNDYEPDVCYFRPEKAINFKKDQSPFPAPDLVVEVCSPKTESRDRGIKFEDYQNHGVEEYWIISPDDRVLEQYHLEDGAYRLIKKSDGGEVRSFVLPDLSFPIAAIFDKKHNLSVIATLLK